MKRKDALRAIQVAGYHGDNSTFTRLYIENRVSIVAAREAYQQGASAKLRGISCGCAGCKTKNDETKAAED